MTSIKLITEPTIIPLGEMRVIPGALDRLAKWVAENHPECGVTGARDLLPPDLHRNDNGKLCELAGRGCYMSFGDKAGRKSHKEYMRNILAAPGSNEVSHSAVTYHAKMSFWFGGVSRRLTHEIIRNYVGSNGTQEGNPCERSTRYTLHPGSYVVPPRLLEDGKEERFRQRMQSQYDAYCEYVDEEFAEYKARIGFWPKRMDRKRILEAAVYMHGEGAATSMYWTTNPAALAKMFRERCHSAADLEFQRFAEELRRICYERWPNLFAETLHAEDEAEESQSGPPASTQIIDLGEAFRRTLEEDEAEESQTDLHASTHVVDKVAELFDALRNAKSYPREDEE